MSSPKLKSYVFFGMLIGLSLILRFYVVEIMVVRSEGMFPNLFKNDFVLVNKLAYGLREPNLGVYLTKAADVTRGDVVLFRSPIENSRPFIKRVVGVEGDTVIYRGGKLFVNNVALADRSVVFKESVLTKYDSMLPGEKEFYHVRSEKFNSSSYSVIAYEFGEKKAYGPYKVPKDSYFVLGDYRPASRDSRFFGAVSRNQIMGKASLVAFSCDKMWDKLKIFCNPMYVRWDRVFTKIP